MDQRLRELAATLAQTGYFNVTIAAMYSPAGARSTPSHIDVCDVLAVQLHGTKKWKVDSFAQTANAHPRQSEARPESFEFIDASEHTTRVGDALFIPRGHVHHAMANERDSLHLVINLLPLTWFDVISELVQDLGDTDETFRSSVLDAGHQGHSRPAGIESSSWLGRISDLDALREAAQQMMRARAREHMTNSFGQLFSKSADDLL
nr:cupin domain-containing protein [Erythrobacter sp. F6033]